MYDDLIIELAGFSGDPYGYVMFAYPWGEPGELEKFDGPEAWQKEILIKVGLGVMSVMEAIEAAHKLGEEAEAMPLRFGRTSGHGIGKSALVSWLIDWAISTMEDTKGIVTANTENQLKTKTWAEFAKWHRLSIAKDLFTLTATSIFSIDPEHEKTWRIDMVPWSERNPEAFAGLHNYGKRILVIFDEASTIADIIHQTTEGAMTDKDTQILWFMFGNPTKNSGHFRECFPGGKFAHRWDTAAIDSRTVRISNKGQIAEWLADYGDDHDFFRVRVKGEFPRVDANSYIPYDLARAAVARDLPDQNHAPVVLGVDVARFGPDNSIIYPRRGRDARTLPPRVFSGLNTMQFALEVLRCYNELGATACFVDGGGVGGGVVDRLEQLGLQVYEVQFGGKPDYVNTTDPGAKYLNKRAEMYGALRQWLSRGCIPETVPKVEAPFPTELSSFSYTYSREDYLQLESKRDLKRRGIPSPDLSDALALTFAYPFLEIPLLPSSAGANSYDKEYQET